MVDASHAALMALNVIPPSPEHLAELLEENIVNSGLLDKGMVNFYEETRQKAKKVLHADINKISGKELEEMQRKSEEFVLKLNEITKTLIRNKKIIKVEHKPYPVR